MGKEKAISRLYLVPSEFHKLNNLLRVSWKENNRPKWKKTANELSRLIGEIADKPEIDGRDLQNFHPNQLKYENGPIEPGSLEHLLQVYGGSQGADLKPDIRWSQYFKSGRKLNEALVCATRADLWKSKFDNEKLWQLSGEENGGVFLSGMPDCRIYFNKKMYAGHSQQWAKKELKGKEAGLKCKGPSKIRLPFTYGISMVIRSNGDVSSSNRLFFSGNEWMDDVISRRKADFLQNEITKTSDYVDTDTEISENFRTKYLSYGLIDIGFKTKNSDFDWGVVRQFSNIDLEINYCKFQRKNLVLLESISTQNNSSRTDVQFVIHQPGKTLYLDKEDLGRFGCFLLVKDMRSIDSSELRFFSEIKKAIYGDLGQKLGWRRSGRLFMYKFNEEEINNDTDSSNTVIDLNDYVNKSPLLQAIRSSNLNKFFQNLGLI